MRVVVTELKGLVNVITFLEQDFDKLLGQLDMFNDLHIHWNKGNPTDRFIDSGSLMTVISVYVTDYQMQAFDSSPLTTNR